MVSLGVLTTPRTFAYDGDIRARSRTECKANRLDFELVRGQRFRQLMRLLRFNNKTGKAEPIDLTDSKLNFRIYHPRSEVDISLTHNASGEEFKKTIALTEDESTALSRLSTEAERQAYVNGLSAAQTALRQLAIEAGVGKE